MKKIFLILVLAALSLFVVSSVSAYVLLSPPRTWDSAPTYIVDDRGASSISDNDGGVSTRSTPSSRTRPGTAPAPAR